MDEEGDPVRWGTFALMVVLALFVIVVGMAVPEGKTWDWKFFSCVASDNEIVLSLIGSQAVVLLAFGWHYFRLPQPEAEEDIHNVGNLVCRWLSLLLTP